MRSKSDFWLVLHQLAGELQREANNDAQRVAQLAEVHDSLPEPTKAVNCEDLELVTDLLIQLRAECRSHFVS
jgi:hypothetical protein